MKFEDMRNVFFKDLKEKEKELVLLLPKRIENGVAIFGDGVTAIRVEGNNEINQNAIFYNLEYGEQDALNNPDVTRQFTQDEKIRIYYDIRNKCYGIKGKLFCKSFETEKEVNDFLGQQDEITITRSFIVLNALTIIYDKRSKWYSIDYEILDKKERERMRSKIDNICFKTKEEVNEFCKNYLSEYESKKQKKTKRAKPSHLALLGY